MAPNWTQYNYIRQSPCKCLKIAQEISNWVVVVTSTKLEMKTEEMKDFYFSNICIAHLSEPA